MFFCEKKNLKEKEETIERHQKRVKTS